MSTDDRSTNPFNEQSPYFNQDFAFSTNYLDYEIPDFRGIIDATIPVLVHGIAILSVVEGSPRPLDVQSFPSWITDIQSRKIKLICNDAVGFHRAALSLAGNNAELKEMAWQLTDSCSLWDVSLFEQRLIWATEGRVIDRPDFRELLTKYQVPQTVSSLDGLHVIFQSQFTRLIDDLPFLKNDIAGRRVFREREYDSPHIPAPRRVLARDNVHFKERLHLFVPTIEGWLKYGPACIGLDVQAAIALHYQNENKCDAIPESAAKYRKKKIELQDRLMKDWLEDCYKTFKQCRENGSPIYAEENARDQLHGRWRATTSSEEIELPVYVQHVIDGKDIILGVERISSFQR